MGLPCCHILRVTNELNASMCHIRWWEDYISFFDKRPDVTNVLLSLQSADSPGVLFTGFAEQETDNGSVSTFLVLCDG